jgi:hypothetical protein
MNVSSGNRVKRLRELVDQLERLPESPERDRMLREVRARVVDVDTGAVPRPVLPVDPDSMPPSDQGSPAPQAPRATPAGEDRRRRATAQSAPARRAQMPPREAEPRPRPILAADGAPRGADDLLALAADELLWLDDSGSFSASETPDGPTTGPWTRGLRG